jgi:hypothetical protein
MHFSPEKPEGVDDKNRIQTNPKESWFDKTWPLNDFELTE